MYVGLYVCMYVCVDVSSYVLSLLNYKGKRHAI